VCLSVLVCLLFQFIELVRELKVVRFQLGELLLVFGAFALAFLLLLVVLCVPLIELAAFKVLLPSLVVGSGIYHVMVSHFVCNVGVGFDPGLHGGVCKGLRVNLCVVVWQLGERVLVVSMLFHVNLHT
jgi:hypothetical protein